MGVLKIIQKGIAFAATAAVSSGLTYWLCADNNERTVAELRERVAELQGKELSAMVNKACQRADGGYASSRRPSLTSSANVRETVAHSRFGARKADWSAVFARS